MSHKAGLTTVFFPEYIHNWSQIQQGSYCLKGTRCNVLQNTVVNIQGCQQTCWGPGQDRKMWAHTTKNKASSALDMGQTIFFQYMGGAQIKKKHLYLSKSYQLRLQGYFVYSITCKVMNINLIKKQILGK